MRERVMETKSASDQYPERLLEAMKKCWQSALMLRNMVDSHISMNGSLPVLINLKGSIEQMQNDLLAGVDSNVPGFREITLLNQDMIQKLNSVMQPRIPAKETLSLSQSKAVTMQSSHVAGTFKMPSATTKYFGSCFETEQSVSVMSDTNYLALVHISIPSGWVGLGHFLQVRNSRAMVCHRLTHILRSNCNVCFLEWECILPKRCHFLILSKCGTRVREK